MNCLILNPNKILDDLVSVAKTKSNLVVVDLTQDINEYMLSLDLFDDRPAVVFVHLDTVLNNGDNSGWRLINPFTYTAIITSHKERPPEANFIWHRNIFTFQEVIDDMDTIVANGVSWLDADNRVTASKKFRTFSLFLKEGKMVRLKGAELISIKKGPEKIIVATKDGNYSVQSKMEDFSDITFMPDFNYVNAKTIINMNMVTGIENNFISLQNGENVELEEKFSKAFWQGMNSSYRMFA